MKKRIQIPVDLFELMAGYIRDHYDPEDRDRYTRIESGIREKRGAMIRHGLYSVYKSNAPDIVREFARQEYLDAVGICEDFRWTGLERQDS